MIYTYTLKELDSLLRNSQFKGSSFIVVTRKDEYIKLNGISGTCNSKLEILISRYIEAAPATTINLLEIYPLDILGEGQDTEFWAHPRVALDLAYWIGDQGLISNLSGNIECYPDMETKILVEWDSQTNTFYTTSLNLAANFRLSHKEVIYKIHSVIDELCILDNSDRKEIVLKYGFKKVIYLTENRIKKAQYCIATKATLLLIGYTMPVAALKVKLAYLDAFENRSLCRKNR